MKDFQIALAVKHTPLILEFAWNWLCWLAEPSAPWKAHGKGGLTQSPKIMNLRSIIIHLY